MGLRYIASCSIQVGICDTSVTLLLWKIEWESNVISPDSLTAFVRERSFRCEFVCSWRPVMDRLGPVFLGEASPSHARTCIPVLVAVEH